jgi:hypothetical protein
VSEQLAAPVAAAIAAVRGEQLALFAAAAPVASVAGATVVAQADEPVDEPVVDTSPPTSGDDRAAAVDEEDSARQK